MAYFYTPMFYKCYSIRELVLECESITNFIAHFLFIHLGKRILMILHWLVRIRESCCPLYWTDLNFAHRAKPLQRCLCTVFCPKVISFHLSYKCSGFPGAKVTSADEAPPKPPRLFLMANSKESTPSPADSPVIVRANRETFLWWLVFFQGLVLLNCLLLKEFTVLLAGSTSLAGSSPGIQNPVSCIDMEYSQKCCTFLFLSLIISCFSWRSKMWGRSTLGVQSESTERMTAETKQRRRVSRLLGANEVPCH